MDLRCPICGSSRVNYYGTSTTVGGGYESTDARYVCENCRYVGALILDVSNNIDEKTRKEVERDLEEIRKELEKEENM